MFANNMNELIGVYVADDDGNMTNLGFCNNLTIDSVTEDCLNAWNRNFSFTGSLIPTAIEKRLNNTQIYEIKILVPDKVMEVTIRKEFITKKIKCIVQEPDQFDLKRGLFIALAKFLYADKYTVEGIEYMATQLAMKKEYVKVVHDAMVEFNKKERERIKAEKEAEEIKERKLRKKAKRAARKERKEKEKKESRINELAEAIRRATNNA